MTEVLVRHGERIKIKKHFQVSDVTIRRALKGKTKSPLAKEIRDFAIDKIGGLEEKAECINLK